MEESVKLFCEELNIPRSRCGSYITHKIGPHKIVWDQVKSKEDLVEQICFSEELNDLERFFMEGSTEHLTNGFTILRFMNAILQNTEIRLLS